MTKDQNENPKQDWNKLATEALDLWQNHLNALASDPKVKEEVTRFVTPMTQMFSQWTEVMQSGLQGMAGFGATMNPKPAADDVSDAEVMQDTAQKTDAADTKGDSADVQPDATIDTRGGAGTESDFVAPVQQHSEPDISVVTVPSESSMRGRSAPSDGARDLAQLASRLAQLERELDGLRPKKRSADSAADADPTSDGAVQRVAGTD